MRRSRDPAIGSTAAVRSYGEILATAKGSSFLAGGSFFEFATRFVIAFLLARLLGAQDYGLYVLALSAATLFSGISLLGLDDAMVRYVAILSGRRDDVGLRGTLQIGLGVTSAAGVIMAAVLFLGAEPIAEGLFDEPRLTDLLRLMALVVPFLTMSNVLTGTARGFKRMDYAALAENVVMSVVRMALLAVMALVGQLSIVAAVLIFGISDVAASVTLIVLLNKRFPLKEALGPDARRDTREVFAFALPLWLSGMLRKFRNNIQTLMLGALSAATGVGIFAVVARINLVGHVFMASMTVAVKPILAQLHDRRDRAGLAHVYRTATRWTLTINMPFFLVMVLYPSALLSVFGDAFTAGASALVILAFAELAGAATGICGPMIDMTGHTRVKLANSVLYTTLAIAGGVALIPRWGVVGAAVAALIAMATVNIVCVIEVWFLERFTPFDWTFWKPISAGIGALATGWAMAMWRPVGTHLGLAVLQGTVVTGVYAGLILLLRPAPEDRLVIQRMLAKVATVVGRARAVFKGAGGSG